MRRCRNTGSERGLDEGRISEELEAGYSMGKKVRQPNRNHSLGGARASVKEGRGPPFVRKGKGSPGELRDSILGGPLEDEPYVDPLDEKNRLGENSSREIFAEGVLQKPPGGGKSPRAPEGLAGGSPGRGRETIDRRTPFYRIGAPEKGET